MVASLFNKPSPAPLWGKDPSTSPRKGRLDSWQSSRRLCPSLTGGVMGWVFSL